MTRLTRILHARGLWSLALLGLTVAEGARCQFERESPDVLVKFLTQDSSAMSRRGLASCGVDQQEAFDRGAARALVRLGTEAVPAIARALDALEANGHLTNASRLMYVYATILGQAAMPRILRMASDPKLDMFAIAIDDSAAISIGSTSYVSSTRALLPAFRCRGPQPRDALDQLIFGWERNDRAWMEASMGPHSKASMASLLKSTNWEEMRNAIWPAKLSQRSAVGYRFAVQHPWSQPQAAIGDDVDMSSDTPTLLTNFKTRTGEDCGNRTVKFLRASSPDNPRLTERYFVDETDLSALLHTISACAAR